MKSASKAHTSVGAFLSTRIRASIATDTVNPCGTGVRLLHHRFLPRKPVFFAAEFPSPKYSLPGDKANCTGQTFTWKVRSVDGGVRGEWWCFCPTTGLLLPVLVGELWLDDDEQLRPAEVVVVVSRASRSQTEPGDQISLLRPELSRAAPKLLLLLLLLLTLTREDRSLGFVLRFRGTSSSVDRNEERGSFRT